MLSRTKDLLGNGATFTMLAPATGSEKKKQRWVAYYAS
jgi:hypothetical protein